MPNNNYEFRALGVYKEKLFRLLVNSELSDLLIDILMPTLDDDRFDKVENFLGGEFSYNTDTGTEIVKLQGHLFDVPFIYNTITTASNVICIDTNISKNTSSLKEMSTTISILCQKDSLLLDSNTRLKYKKLGYIGRNRLDIAVAILGDILNGSKKFGIGKLNPVPYNPVKSSFPNNDYFGKILDFICSDFMTDYGKRGGSCWI